MSFHGQAKRAVSGRVGGPADRPVEIAFLERHGVAPPVLDEAARLTRATGVSGDDALLRAGLIAEDRYYRALADELHLPFLERFALDPAAPYNDRGPVEIARLDRDEAVRYVMAPARTRLTWLLLARRPLPRDFAIATPTALREAVFAVRGSAIADEAANGLVRAAPHLSIRSGPNRAQLAAAAILVVCGAIGTQASPLTGTMLFVLSSAAFLAMVTVRLMAAQYRAPIDLPPGPRWDDRDLPVYTVLVALHRESEVLPQLLAAIAALDYPAPKLDVMIVLETGDDETSDALARLSPPPFVEVIVAPPGQPRTKPRALNVALPFARGEFLVVYDAEDRPDPQQLRDAVATFARLGPEAACLQGRLVIDNTGDSWLTRGIRAQTPQVCALIPLTRLFTIEYAALFDVINPALAALGWPVPLGGTSTHLRTSILREVHGWDAWNVTEDADLGIRLALLGYQVADLPSSTLEEAPATIPAWMHQRARWMKGFMQVCITHSRHPIRAARALGGMRFFAAMTMTFGTVAAALAFPLCTVLSLDAFLGDAALKPASFANGLHTAVGLVLFAAGLLAMVAPGFAGVRRRGWWTLLPWVALLPFYFILASVAAWRGLYELLRDPFHWNKTRHGLAVTSRAGDITAGAGARPRPPAAGGRG